MSNSQNKKNEQQNNLCTTLTEKWKKGELKSGWYFVKVGNYEAEIDLYDDDQNQWFNCCDKDIYPVEILAPVPSYEELEQLKIDNHSLNAWIKNFQPKYKEMEKENQQLKELLHSLKCCLTSQNIEPQIRVEKSLAKIDEVLK